MALAPMQSKKTNYITPLYGSTSKTVDVQHSNTIKVVPNPSTENFDLTFDMGIPQKGQIQIYNSTGRMVFTTLFGVA